MTIEKMSVNLKVDQEKIANPKKKDQKDWRKVTKPVETCVILLSSSTHE